jgi:hypothetical protein
LSEVSGVGYLYIILGIGVDIYIYIIEIIKEIRKIVKLVLLNTPIILY